MNTPTSYLSACCVVLCACAFVLCCVVGLLIPEVFFSAVSDCALGYLADLRSSEYRSLKHLGTHTHTHHGDAQVRGGSRCFIQRRFYSRRGTKIFRVCVFPPSFTVRYRIECPWNDGVKG